MFGIVQSYMNKIKKEDVYQFATSKNVFLSVRYMPLT